MPFNVRMPNGKVLENIPDGTSKEQIEQKIRDSGKEAEFGLKPVEVDIGPRNKGKVFKSEEIGILERTGNMLGDFMKALKVHGDAIPQNAFRALQPDKVLNLKGDGFVSRHSDEGKTIKKLERAAYESAVHAPDEDDAISVAANITSLLTDPTLVAAGAITMPSRVVIGANATRGQKATAQITRMMKIFGSGSGIVGAIEAMDQAATDGKISDPAKLAQLAALGGVGGVVIDRAIAGLGAILTRPGMTARKADKIVTSIENRSAELRQEGLNPGTAAKKAFSEQGIIDSAALKSIEDLAKRRVDFSKSFADIKLPLSTKVYNKLGLNKLAVPERIENIITPLTTQINDISPKIMAGIRKFELGAHQGAQRLKEIARPFMENIESGVFRKGLSKAEKRALKKAVLNGDAATVRQLSINKGGTALNDSYLTVRKMLDETFDTLKAEGFEVGKTPNFFPRLVKDLDGLVAAMGKQQGSDLQRALKEAAKGKSNGVLTQQEMSDVVNKFIRGFAPRIGNKPSVLKERRIDEIPDELLDFYADPVESLVNYIDNVTHSIAKHRFFGMNAPKAKRLDSDDVQSIGDLISEEILSGNIRLKDADKLRELLQARFIGGEKVASKFIQNSKNIFYSATLGQPTSAATQVGDLGISAFVNGFLNTVKGITGKKLLRVDELGIANKVAEEFGSSVKTAKFLNNVLKASGFKFVDRLGKTANINGAIRKAMDQVKIQNGQVANQRKFMEFVKKWQPIFGDETKDLVKSLQSGKIDDNVKLLAWNALSDVQPITLSEMPLAYLNSPNGRVFYMLKSFTIKQLDILRREAFRKIANGDVVGGTSALIRFSMFFTAANMGASEIKDFIKGRDVDIEDKVVDNIYRNFGLSEYIVNMMGRKGIETSTLDFFAPAMFTMPLGELDSILRNSDDIGKAANSMGKNMPVIGQLYYQWFGGGIEAFEERQRKLEKQKRKER